MFEKEAKQYADNNCECYEYEDFSVDDRENVEKAYHQGANDVYNKLNKWHNLEENPNDLPKENMKQVIVELSDGSYEMGYYCIHNKTWWNNDCPDYDDELGYHDIKYDIHIYPIKWKEIM